MPAGGSTEYARIPGRTLHTQITLRRHTTCNLSQNYITKQHHHQHHTGRCLPPGCQPFLDENAKRDVFLPPNDLKKVQFFHNTNYNQIGRSTCRIHI